MRVKILQIAPAWVNTPPTDYGGTEWVIYNLVKGLTELGHDVTLFATKNSQAPANLEYVFEKNLLEQGIDWRFALPSLIHYHQAFKLAPEFDIVHAHLSSDTDLMLLPFLSDLTESSIPNVMTIHSHFPFDLHSQMDSYYLNYYASNITAINISKAMQARMPREFWDGGFVHNSLDLSAYKFNPNGGDYFTWLGKIIPAKGISEAIKAALQAHEKLVFAGVVDEYEPVSVEYWKKKVEPFVDGKQIIYLGPADLKVKNKLLGGAKAFLNPISWDEPFGMVLVESMACGTPVISYSRGAVLELIKDGKTGFLVNNPTDLIEAMKKVNRLERKDSRVNIEQNFSIQASTLKYLNAYRKEIHKHQLGIDDEVIIPSVQTTSLLVDPDSIGVQYNSPSIAHTLTIRPPKKKS